MKFLITFNFIIQFCSDTFNLTDSLFRQVNYMNKSKAEEGSFLKFAATDEIFMKLIMTEKAMLMKTRFLIIMNTDEDWLSLINIIKKKLQTNQFITDKRMNNLNENSDFI